jgi:hypothetical protein
MQHLDKILVIYVWNICNIQINTFATYVLKKQMKHWEQKLATYVYNHCNICNIPIYFYNIRIKHLQHTSETSGILETYTYNMRCSLFFSCTTQRGAEDGQAKGSAVTTPSGDKRRGWQGQAISELWPRCGLPPLQAGSGWEEGASRRRRQLPVSSSHRQEGLAAGGAAGAGRVDVHMWDFFRARIIIEETRNHNLRAFSKAP